MMRLVALLLVLVNAAYYAWTQGLLEPAGFAPAVQTEPQRLAQQIKPEAMRLLSASDVRQLDVPAADSVAIAAPAECLQAGLYNDNQTEALKTRLAAALPGGSWTLESGVEPARWLVYMGKYANADAVAKKRGELRQRGVSFEPLNNASLEPGLSLGHFTTQADAEAELARISTRGVRTARVLQERPELRGQRLRLASVDASLKALLEPFKGQLEGKPLQACR